MNATQRNFAVILVGFAAITVGLVTGRDIVRNVGSGVIVGTTLNAALDKRFWGDE